MIFFWPAAVDKFRIHVIFVNDGLQKCGDLLQKKQLVSLFDQEVKKCIANMNLNKQIILLERKKLVLLMVVAK